MKKIKLKIKGMHCNSCANLIEETLLDFGIKSKVSFATEKANIEFNDEKMNEEDITHIITKLGYEVKK